MWGVVLRSILGAIPVLLIVSLITFGMMRLIPGRSLGGHWRAVGDGGTA